MISALPSDLASFVEQQVSSGHFSSADAMVQAGLRLLQERENRLDKLRAMLQEGLDCEARGEYVELTTEADYRRHAEDIKRRGRELQRLQERENKS